ncbi:MAG: permease, partial [Proteobacteria bacterium]|nr:permease [Pseudomonadota bacterium]
MGMGLGAALAFMVAGGVTSIPAAMAVFALVKRTVFLWYLALGLAGSLIVGFAYQAVLGL